MSITKCKDHMGNEFGSISEMCRFWRVPLNTYCGRKERGHSLEACLTGVGVMGNAKKCKDHLGKEYPSERQMLAEYGVEKGTYRDRIACGWTLEDALTKPAKWRGIIGNEHIGLKKRMNCGLDAKIVEYKNHKDITVEFEDGTKRKARYCCFISGKIAHPTLRSSGRGEFQGFDICYRVGKDPDGYTWYAVECQECKARDIMTPQMMINNAHMSRHKKNCIMLTKS